MKVVMKLWVVVMMLATGCTHVNRATLATSTAVIVCDWGQTRNMAMQNWDGGNFTEMNPLLGPAPSTGNVDAYFAASAALNVAVWLLMPERYRSVVPAGVIVMQTKTIVGNTPNTGLCGL
jgi:hypothetical protein